MGHRAYGVFIAPGMGLRQNDVKGTAVDDQAEGQYWVINGHHYNSGCCFDYGNAEIDSRDDDNGTMETTYYGNATGWFHGNPPGPWIMTDQENNLVGCVNPDGSKLCPTLPNISWRFVTAMAKGEPHHWSSLGGDAQRGPLQVMFDGPRVDVTYDPMRKQGAILLGNGGDNSVGSQGTFYEGAMTAAETFPSDATDQLVQANVVAARYDVAGLTLAPASATAKPPGLQTFSPGSSQETTITFTNTTGVPVTAVQLGVSGPRQWTSVALGSARFAGPIAPGASVSATFKITSGPAAFNGDLYGSADWTNQSTGQKQSEGTREKVRNVSPVKINEFRISGGNNSTNSFIELVNAGSMSDSKAVDISNWTLTEHAMQQAIFSNVQIPAGTKLAAGRFYLLGLANSGLAAPARKGDTNISVRSTTGMNAGDSISIDTGAGTASSSAASRSETRKIVSIGTAAGNSTTLWQPLPDGPVITIPAGSTNVPVTNVRGFTAGEKIAIGYGARHEVATVTVVGKQGTQAFLGADAAGSSNIKVTSVANISAGDKIRLDIDSVGHGIETVTVVRVGTQSSRSALSANVSAGVTNIRVRNANGFTVGDKMTVGTPANKEFVTITAVNGGGAGRGGTGGGNVDFTPALTASHLNREFVVAQGTGLDLAGPLKFNHAANLPFSVRGTGITFQPATSFDHASNEPVQPLGTGIALDSPLAKDHAVDAVVYDAAVRTAGYQSLTSGTPAPNQWFGGPALSSAAGSIVLRDAAGLVVDSLNCGLLVDPWASKGYQATSGTQQGGCRVASPGGPGASMPNRSAGRFPDGVDTDSNCDDFVVPPATNLPAGAAIGATNIKVSSVAGFSAGQAIVIDAGEDAETALVAMVGPPGAATLVSAVSAGATSIPVPGGFGFSAGQTITIEGGANERGANNETAVIASTAGGRGGFTIAVTTPLKFAHPSGAPVSGSGITLAAALTKTHPSGASITSDVPTPGAPNRYYGKRN